MKNNSANNKNYILSTINKLGKSLITEIKKVEKSIRVETLKIEERVENLEEGQERMEKKLDKISTQLDGFVGRVDDLTTENQIGTGQISELREITASHEQRISKLETVN
jgi:chromosome segregation ATPase